MSSLVGFSPLPASNVVLCTTDEITNAEQPSSADDQSRSILRKRTSEEDTSSSGKSHRFISLSSTKAEWATVSHCYESSKYYINECSFRIFSNLEESMKEILDTSLQTLSLKLIKKDLKNFKDLLPGKDQELFIKIHGLIKTALLLSREFTLIQHKPNEATTRVQQLAEYIREKIKDMKIGEAFVIPGGYPPYFMQISGRVKLISGHAVLYEIIKNSTTRYSFEIFNTGSGCLDLDDDPTNKLTASLKFDNVHLDNLSNDLFLLELIRIKAMPKAITMDEVLNHIKFHLGSSRGAQTVLGDCYERQLRGSCSYSSAIALIESKLPQYYVKWFKGYIETKALDSIPQLLLENQTMMAPEAYSLFEDVYIERLSSDDYLD